MLLTFLIRNSVCLVLFQSHINGPSAELSQASLQALGFCVYHSHVASGLPGTSSDLLIILRCAAFYRSSKTKLPLILLFAMQTRLQQRSCWRSAPWW